MPVPASKISRLILDAFPEAKVTIKDLAGDGNHYAAEVVYAGFEGMNRVQQQRAVYDALKDIISGPNGELHALALSTKVTE